MKNNLTKLSFLIFFAAVITSVFFYCNNNKPKPVAEIETKSGKKTIPDVIMDTTWLGQKKHEVCTFGLDTAFYGQNARKPKKHLSKQQWDELAARPVKKPHGKPQPPTPPPPVDTTVVNPPPPPTGSAKAMIFLAFNGWLVSGTSWNYNGDFLCDSSMLDKAQQQAVLDGVADSYAFDPDIITTADQNEFNNFPGKKMVVVITITSGWYGNNAGGVGFVGSITWGSNPVTPCFVFSKLLNYNTKYITEAAKHEPGHTLGLYHQKQYDVNGAIVSEYDMGGCTSYFNNAGECGWCSTMGAAYYQPLSLWRNGPTQNDTAIIGAVSRQ